MTGLDCGEFCICIVDAEYKVEGKDIEQRRRFPYLSSNTLILKITSLYCKIQDLMMTIWNKRASLKIIMFVEIF
jgi:hypothetical protein